MCPTSRRFDRYPRKEASALVLTLLLSIVLGAFVASQVMFTQKNIQQANHMGAYADLYKYAESGIDLSLHDLKYKLSNDEGKIGTASWVVADDTGRDGIPGTDDEGEGDGLPTPGEPNVTPLPVGPAELGIGLVVHVEDTGFAGVKRVVGTATDGNLLVTVQKYNRETRIAIPVTGALFVDPDAAIDLKGNTFLIDGNDHNPGGSPGSAPAIPGISTAIGDPPGDNAAALMAQINPKNYDQVLGEGGEPSVAELPPVDFEKLFDQFKSLQTNSLEPGTYSYPDMGDWDSGYFPVTHVDGDLNLNGSGHGAGVLVVEGSLSMSGQSTFAGLILVKGDVTITGGGSGVHVWGAVMAGETSGDSPAIKFSGNGDLMYSSSALSKVAESLPSSFDLVFYEEK